MFNVMTKKMLEIFREHGGQMRMSEAVRSGISRYHLSSMVKKGIFEKITRGVYRLASAQNFSYPDIQLVCSKSSKAVIFLISALVFHRMTTQIQRSVSIAIIERSRPPTVNGIRLDVHYLKPDIYSAGIEEHTIDGVKIKVYDPEKTLVDCFRFRNKIGLDVAIEALKFYRERGRMDVNKIYEYAKMSRVVKVMQPYLEAVV